MSDEHIQVVKRLEERLLTSQTNSIVIPMTEFYALAGRERLTKKFYGGVTEAGDSRHLLIAFGENVVAVTRDVAPFT